MYDTSYDDAGAQTWREIGFDPTEIVFFYQSPPGTLLLMLKV